MADAGRKAEAHRARVLNGRIQWEGEVAHLMAQRLFDLSGDLPGLADRDPELELPAGRGEFAIMAVPIRAMPKPVVQLR